MYEGTLNVLKKINLELEKGEKVALVGGIRFRQISNN